jgi:ATP-dependent Clp protease ATP-binding subunit ClpC
MFERFTDRARRVVVLAQEEARMLNHNYIGTEHILLGLIHEGEGVAATALESMDISLEAVRSQVEAIIGQGVAVPTGHIPFTPRAKKVLELSLREAMQLGHNYIGTEHILLGLVREGEGVAAQVLEKLGADLNRIRQVVVALLSSGVESERIESETLRSAATPKDQVRLAAQRASRARRLAEQLAASVDDPSVTPELVLQGLLLTEDRLLTLEVLVRRTESEGPVAEQEGETREPDEPPGQRPES